MEESGRTTELRRRTGLLALFMALSLPCFTQSFAEQIYTLTPFVSETGALSGTGAVTYTVLIAGTAPADVFLSLPDGITPLTSKKETRYYSVPGSSDDSLQIPSGLYTTLEFTLSPLHLEQTEPLTAVLTLRKAGAPSTEPETITIALDSRPESSAQLPEPGLFWDVSADTLSAGEQAILTLRTVNASFAGDVSFSLPENALLSLLSEESVGEGFLEEDSLGEGNLSGSPEGGIRFSWTPLFSGEQPLPSVTAAVTGLGGETKEISSTPALVSVERLSSRGASSSLPSPIIREAFSAPAASSAAALGTAPNTSGDVVLQTELPPPPKGLTEPPLNVMAAALAPALAYWSAGSYPQALALLRGLEKRSPLFPLYRHIRKEAEASLGITGTDNPVPGGLLPVAFVVIVLFFILFLLIRKKHPVAAVFALFLSGAGLAAGIFLAIGAASPQGVHTGGIVKTIPEKSSSVLAELPPGTPVRIGKQAGSWSEIHFGENRSGWTETVFVIPY
ncbi:MAG: SH3 domain-containing protein [Spirochaetaceae bacterium]|jgi:hypothetical protein|nr:SH3 domain-containing protein [Spirochaetaceae bacterium]